MFVCRYRETLEVIGTKLGARSGKMLEFDEGRVEHLKITAEFLNKLHRRDGVELRGIFFP